MEAKLILHADPEINAGQAPVLIVRATAMVNDTLPVVHETKVTVNVVK
jgi:hypothetical protein